jgi:hypothetical protein
VRRYRIGGLAGCAAVLGLVAVASAPTPRPLELAAPSTTARLGVVATRSGSSLVRLNPVSLKRVGRPLELKGFTGAWAFAPDRRLVAVGVRQRSESSFETLRFSTVARPQRTGRGVALGGVAAALLWPRADRILAYVNECCPNPNGAASILVIDPVARQVVARTPVDGAVLQIGRSRDSLVLLVAGTNRIGPSRLEIFDADGRHRSARLDELAAGYTWPDDPSGDRITTRLVPGLAIDANGNRAFAVSPAGLVGEVDLGSLVVSYHRWAESRSALKRFATWLTPSAQAKGANGPALIARWLEGGFLAVAGTDETATVVGGNLRVASQPLGLRIVDVRDWSASMLDPGADSFAVADGLLLVTGSSWSSELQSESGMGLAAYGTERVRRFQFLPGRPLWISFVYRGRAYVSSSGETALQVIDLASGRMIGTRRGDAPWPLLDDSVRLFG